MFKSTIFLVTLSLLQLSMCSPVEDFRIENLQSSRTDVLVELNAKVLQLQLNISSTVLQVGTSITDSVRAENNDVDAARNAVKANLKNLDELVKNATLAAKESNKSIDACLKEEKKLKKQVNLRKISKCASPVSLNLLRLKLTEFSALNLKTYSIVPKCTVLHPFDNDKLEECGLTSIDGYRKNMDEIKNKIQSDAKAIVRKDHTCILENADDLKETIKGISDIFTLCVDSA